MQLRLSAQARQDLDRKAARKRAKADKAEAAAARKIKRARKAAEQQERRDATKIQRARCAAADAALTEAAAQFDERNKTCLLGQKVSADRARQLADHRVSLTARIRRLEEELQDCAQSLEKTDTAAEKLESERSIGSAQRDQSLVVLQAAWAEAEEAWDLRPTVERKKNRDGSARKNARRLLGL